MIRLSLGLLLVFSSAFPLWGEEVRDALGRRVRVPNDPRRIVSLAPNITEILYDLGAEARIVGVTQFSNYPPRAREKPEVGSFVNLNLERIISLNPDLIIGTADGNRRESVERLSEFGLPVYLIHPRNMEEIFESIVRIGALIHSRKEAQSKVQALRDRVLNVQESVHGRPRPRVFLQLSLHPLITCGQGTFQDNLIHMAGGENIAGKERTRYPRYSIEEVLSQRPEVILVTSMHRAGGPSPEILYWRQWKDLPAVRRDRVWPIDSDLVDRPSPRIVLGLEEMARLFHPDVAGRIGNGR